LSELWEPHAPKSIQKHTGPYCYDEPERLKSTSSSAFSLISFQKPRAETVRALKIATPVSAFPNRMALFIAQAAMHRDGEWRQRKPASAIFHAPAPV
jgi:hypothetical protein